MTVPSSTPTLPPIPADLDKLSDRDLNELVATCCCGFKRTWLTAISESMTGRNAVPDYSGDANAALTLLERPNRAARISLDYWCNAGTHRRWTILFQGEPAWGKGIEGYGPTLARALCVAALRAAASQTPIATSAQKEGCW